MLSTHFSDLKSHSFKDRLPQQVWNWEVVIFIFTFSMKSWYVYTINNLRAINYLNSFCFASSNTGQDCWTLSKSITYLNQKIKLWLQAPYATTLNCESSLYVSGHLWKFQMIHLWWRFPCLAKHVHVHDHVDAQSEGTKIGTYSAILDLLKSHTLTISCKRTDSLNRIAG